MISDLAIMFGIMWFVVTLGEIALWFITEELPKIIRKKKINKKVLKRD